MTLRLQTAGESHGPALVAILTGLPAGVTQAVQQSVFSGIAVAARLHSPVLRESVRQAFVQGMDAALVVSAVVAVVAMMLALAFMPGRLTPASEEAPATRKVESVA